MDDAFDKHAIIESLNWKMRLCLKGYTCFRWFTSRRSALRQENYFIRL